MLLSFKNCGITCVDSSSSSSVVGSNIDLLIQILLCLPVKSLLVFKTVSKQWISLISDPSFVQNHCIQHRYSINATRLLVLNSKFKIVSLDGNVFDPINPPGSGFVPFNDTKEFINIIQSCNGLLLCRHLCYSTFQTTYYIYNPSTMHYKILPQSPFKKHYCNNNNNNNRRLSLAFDPIKSPHYHAICIWWKHGQIEIYSSETDSWRDSISVVNAQNDMFDKSGVYWNGSLHWVNTSTGLSLYFDIERELMTTMPSLPDVITRWRCINYFGVYKDHLHLIEIYPHMKGRCDILEMKNDYKGWNVKVRLDLNDFIKVPHPDINWDDISVYYVLNNGYGFSILKFFDEEEEGEPSKLVIQMWKDLNIFSYDLKEMSFKKISSGSSSWLHDWPDTHLYIPTLARV